MAYKVLSPILHDGRAYEPGETIDLAAEDAAGLLALGRIEEVAAEAGDAAPAKGKGKGAG